MQSGNVHLHRVSADGLEMVIREVTEMARRKGRNDGVDVGARLRSVVEFLLRPSLVQVQQLAAVGSKYTDPKPKPERRRVVCPICEKWVYLTPKKDIYIYPVHKVSTHDGRCETSGKAAVCLICKKNQPKADDEFCESCLDEMWATAPEWKEDDATDCREIPA